MHPIDTQRKENEELHVFTIYLTTRQKIMCTFWKNERNVIHSMNTGLIHVIRQIYVCFDSINDLFTTRSKIFWFIQIVVHSMSTFLFFDVKSWIWVEMSIFLSKTVTLIVLHILITTRLENLDEDENIVGKSEKIKSMTRQLYIFQIFYCFRVSYNQTDRILFKCWKFPKKAVFNSRGKKQKLQWGQQKTEFQHKNDKTQFSTVSQRYKYNFTLNPSFNNKKYDKIWVHSLALPTNVVSALHITIQLHRTPGDT